MGKIVSKTFLSDSMVCNFLNEIKDKPSENAPFILFFWRHAKETTPGPDKPLICQTDGGKILTFKSRGDEKHWEWHVDKYHIKYWAYQEDLLAEKSTGNTQE